MWVPRRGTPFFCCVNDREYARPFLGPRGAGAAGASIVRAEGLVVDSGLFPASNPLARVIVESSTSPSGYGSRGLTAHELGNLWEVPILFLDSLPETDVDALMGAICASPPSKLLHTGADLLLTSSFWGGGVGRERGRGSASGQVSARELSGPPGPRPLSDQELRLKRAAPLQDKVSPGEKRPRLEFPPQDEVSTEASTKVSTATEVSTEDSTAAKVIKGDSQKADNASVPDHLWLRAFVIGYGDKACAERHREALALQTGNVGALGALEPPAEWRGVIPAHTTRGYIAWRKTNMPLTPGTGGQMVWYRWQASKCPVYEWTAKGRRLYQAEWRTLRAHPDGRAMVEVGYNAIHRCADASWFEWPKGSAPLFWNWGPEYQRAVRDGQPHFMIGALEEPFMRKQAKAKDSLKHELMRAKVVQVHQRGYIEPGNVTSGTHFFCVDKGTLDYRT